MSDPANGTVEPDRPPIPGTPTAASAEPFGLPAGGEVKPGLAWQGLEIEALVPDAPDQFVARDTVRGEKVLVHVRPSAVVSDGHRTAWSALCELREQRILRCHEAREEGGWRYEITAVPSSMTLREWIACHQSGAQEVEAFVRQLAPALAALHSRGIGHFNVCPDAIHIEEVDGDQAFVLGGLQAATRVDQTELIPLPVNPMYAPPEAAGLTQHPPGARLLAWDWWSLGRVAQEFLLGRHVLGLLLDRDVSRLNPDLLGRAEALLLEREPAGVRAGAVEHMAIEGPSLLLLRGLLTGSADARWGLEAVQRWLRREQVREYYDLPRTARLWTWENRALTLPDAADHFTQTAHWEQGVQMLVDADRPDSLAHFLRETPTYRAEWDVLRSIFAMTESGGWEQIEPDTRRMVAAAIAWLALANGGGNRATFRICGQTIDSPGLAELLNRHPGGAAGVALVNALLNSAVIDFLETLDSTASRVLKGLASKAGAAARTAIDQGWLKADDAAEYARLLTTALERSVVLQDRHALLQAAYATTGHAELSRILHEKTPPPAELVLSAYTGGQPDRFGYVTHREWRHQRFLACKAQADALTAALLWLRLDQLLAIARLWSAPWKVFTGISCGLAVMAGWLNRSVQIAATVAVVLLLGRVWLVVRARSAFRRSGDPTPVWGWRDGLERTRREAARVRAETQGTLASLDAELLQARAAMAEYAWTQRDGAGVRPQWWDAAAVFALGAVITCGALVRGLVQVPTIAEVVASAPAVAAAAPEPRTVHVENATQASAPLSVTDNPEQLLATGKFEVVDDGFGRRLRGPLQAWDHFSPPSVPALAVEARARALPGQAAFAMVNASVLLRPYLRSTIVGLLAVRVPTTRGIGVMIVNARDRKLLNHEVVLLEPTATPQDRTWYGLDRRHVFYVEGPLPLDAEISLAPW